MGSVLSVIGEPAENLFDFSTWSETATAKLSAVVRMANLTDITAGEFCCAVYQHVEWSKVLLKMVNSPVCCSPQPIACVDEAVRRHGVRQCWNFLLTASLFESLQSIPIEDAQLRDRLCLDALRTSLLCRRMNQVFCLGFQGEDLLAGIAADIGRTMFFSSIGRAFQDLYPRTVEQEVEIRALESDYLGKDHAEFGYEVLQSMELPSPIALAVRWHHTPLPQITGCPLAVLVRTASELRYNRDARSLTSEQVQALITDRNIDDIERVSHLNSLHTAMRGLDEEADSMFALLSISPKPIQARRPIVSLSALHYKLPVKRYT